MDMLLCIARPFLISRLSYLFKAEQRTRVEEMNTVYKTGHNKMNLYEYLIKHDGFRFVFLKNTYNSKA